MAGAGGLCHEGRPDPLHSTCPARPEPNLPLPPLRLTMRFVPPQVRPSAGGTAVGDLPGRDPEALGPICPGQTGADPGQRLAVVLRWRGGSPIIEPSAISAVSIIDKGFRWAAAIRHRVRGPRPQRYINPARCRIPNARMSQKVAAHHLTSASSGCWRCSAIWAPAPMQTGEKLLKSSGNITMVVDNLENWTWWSVGATVTTGGGHRPPDRGGAPTDRAHLPEHGHHRRGEGVLDGPEQEVLPNQKAGPEGRLRSPARSPAVPCCPGCGVFWPPLGLFRPIRRPIRGTPPGLHQAVTGFDDTRPVGAFVSAGNFAIQRQVPHHRRPSRMCGACTWQQGGPMRGWSSLLCLARSLRATQCRGPGAPAPSLRPTLPPPSPARRRRQHPHAATPGPGAGPGPLGRLPAKPQSAPPPLRRPMMRPGRQPDPLLPRHVLRPVDLRGEAMPRRESLHPAAAYLSTEPGKPGSFGQFVRELLSRPMRRWISPATTTMARTGAHWG